MQEAAARPTTTGLYDPEAPPEKESKRKRQRRQTLLKAVVVKEAEVEGEFGITVQMMKQFFSVIQSLSTVSVAWN